MARARHDHRPGPVHDASLLFTVAGLALPAQTVGAPEIDDTLRRLVEALDPNPAFVANPWWDLLAYNQAYSALHGGLDARPPSATCCGCSSPPTRPAT